VSRSITIVGASARAAAFSAARAGLDVYAADLFADLDLRFLCSASPVADYPGGLAAAVAGPQGGGWMYTGALENYPSLVDELAQIRRLWGNAGDTLRRVRRPRLVARALERSGLPCPAVAFDPATLDASRHWLIKAIRSAGGLHVARYVSHNNDGRKKGYYFQEFIEGSSCSAVFVAAGGRAVLLGVTRQLIGEAWTGCRGFQYCGSLGPLHLDNATIEGWCRLGTILAEEFELVGLFGVDAVVNAAGVWPVEINPRYTASVEVLERSLSIRAIDLHVAACDFARLPVSVPAPGGTPSGKAVVFARRPFVVPRSWECFVDASADGAWPAYADVPPPGSSIETGAPILTVLATGADEGDVLENLQRNAAVILAATER
jgi:uncharacterized protein